jgi:hypothetical protein
MNQFLASAADEKLTVILTMDYCAAKPPPDGARIS